MQTQGNGRRSVAWKRAAMAVLAVAMATPVWAQQEADKARTRPVDERPVKTFYLKNAAQQNDANEVLVALRNMLDPSTKIYLIASQNAITMRATPEDFKLAQQLLDELDRPHKSYRLTYTLTEMDGGKALGTRQVTMDVVSGQRTTLKSGSKVPVLTGIYNPEKAVQEQQFTYLDVGTNFDATLTEVGEGAQLKTKVEQSSISDEKSTGGFQDPLVRQTVLEGVSMLVPGKKLALGSLDIQGSTRHIEIEVEMVPVK